VFRVRDAAIVEAGSVGGREAPAIKPLLRWS